jgi:hypothetical protein
MARTVTISIPHELGKAEARRRIEKGFGSIEQQLGGGGLKLKFTERWECDRLHFTGGTFGQNVSGHADVGETSVVVEVVLPALLASLAETIKGKLAKQGARLLENKKS